MRDILAQPRPVLLGRLRWVLVVIIVIIAPFVMKELEHLTNFGLITQVNRALIFVALAQGLNIVVGLAGLLDLGYAAFFAIGAYTFGLLTWPTHDIEMSFFLAIWVCALVAALFGIIIGAPTLRLRGDYLAIVTLAFGEIIPSLVRNLGDFTFTYHGKEYIKDYNLTNGSQGLTPLGRPDFSFFERLFGLDHGALNVGVKPTFWYFAIVITSMIVLFAATRLNNSRLGRAWKAIREDETAADFMGVDPIRTKLAAFAIGASFSGLAGAVYASMLGAIFPELFRFQVSIFLLIIVVLSGRGSIWGVLIGGLIIATFDGVFLAQILPDIFNGKILPEYDVQSLRWVFFGSGLIIIMIFRPQGLFPPKSTERKAAPPPPAESTQGVQS
ncbi:MAG: branched-chain amino acid ABC transporter permease [Chloroflexi bacterium]|nr:branched-chain amino acid ABC transporter permease [Chloroflexota bacterium]